MECFHLLVMEEHHDQYKVLLQIKSSYKQWRLKKDQGKIEVVCSK